MQGWRALAIVPVAAMLWTGPAMAQDDAAEDEVNARLVAPAECVTEPRTVEDLTAILALDGEGVQAPPLITITPPLGEIVDADTELAINEVTRTVLACFNAGDIGAAAGLMTENGVKRAYWGVTINEESRTGTIERLQTGPVPRPEDRSVRLIAVTDASTLPDGRVAAFVVINEPILPPAGPETLLFVFANQDGQWLIDDWVDFSIVPADFGAEATPAA
mgnify:CR=1 FL=1